MMRHLPTLLVFIALAGCQGAEAPAQDGGGRWRPDTPWRRLSSNQRVRYLRDMVKRLAPLHAPMAKPKPGDWLAQHKEAGQKFEKYLAADPVTANVKRRVLYIQNIGTFTPEQTKIVRQTAEFMRVYFGLEVKFLKDLPVDKTWPADARRNRFGNTQLLSTHVLQNVLPPRLPDDAAALIAFTAYDLWPGRGWNFVFGQASTRQRVGVWSIHRNGDPAESPQAYRQCLLRTIKTATHETGHMFTLHHCTAHPCNMCGSNSLPEGDRWPLALCNECAPKISHATGIGPRERYKGLAAICRKFDLKTEADFYEKCLKLLPEYGQAP